MCILPSVPPTDPSPARLLPPQARQQLALDALAGQPITQLAQAHAVSRKFVYQQLHQAHNALDQAFAPSAGEPEQLLFWLPVTKPWLRQVALGLLLVCPSSLRGVPELLADLFDTPLALGTVHNILHEAVATARDRNCQEDLARNWIGAHDEIFQASQPVLVGADVASTSCYLLPAQPRSHHRRLRRRSARGPGAGAAGDALPRRCLSRPAHTHPPGPLPKPPGLRRHRHPQQPGTPPSRHGTSAGPQGGVVGRAERVGGGLSSLACLLSG